MLILQTLIYFFVFIVIVFLTLYTMGFAILSLRKGALNNQEIITLSLSLGVVVFVISATILGFLNLRILMLPLIVLVSLLVMIKHRFYLILPWQIFVKDKILSILLLSGIIIQGFINFPSGFSYQDGLYFWSSQGHDGLWHVALMEEIRKNFPLQNPVFAGEKLYNYHFLVDVLMGEFYRIFPFFSPLDLYFRFFPVIFSLMIGISVFAFTSVWQKNKLLGYLVVFFTYFVGSFGYIVSYIKHGTIFGGETTFWAAQINTILGNPPHAISISLMTVFFLSYYFFLKDRTKFWFITSFLIASVLAGFKVSAGLTLLVGLAFAALSELIFGRRWISLVLAGALVLSNFVTIKLMTSGATAFMIFLPWWFIRTMVVAGNRLDWIDLELRRQHYLSVGTWNAYLRVLQLELTAFIIFLVGNLGMRALGLFEVLKKLKSVKTFIKDPLELMLFMTAITGFLIPMLFVQRGIIYNNIQFMQYFLLIFGFYAAIAVYQLINFFKNSILKIVILALVIMLSIPTVIGNLVEFYGRPALVKITNQELEALLYLKNNSKPDDIVLSMPFNQYLSGKFGDQPWPIYAWYSTPYIPALSGLRTYLSAEEQVLITGYQRDERLEKINNFLNSDSIQAQKVFLKENKITYIYLAKGEIKDSVNLPMDILDTFFENDEVLLYKVSL